MRWIIEEGCEKGLVEPRVIVWSLMVTQSGVKSHVEVREFRDNATGWLKGSGPLAVERHGKVVGFYISVEEPRAEGEQFREALLKLERTVEEVVEKTGMSEDELAEAFDLNKELRRSGGPDSDR